MIEIQKVTGRESTIEERERERESERMIEIKKATGRESAIERDR